MGGPLRQRTRWLHMRGGVGTALMAVSRRVLPDGPFLPLATRCGASAVRTVVASAVSSQLFAAQSGGAATISTSH